MMKVLLRAEKVGSDSGGKGCLIFYLERSRRAILHDGCAELVVVHEVGYI